MTKRVQASHHAKRPNSPNASNRTRDEVFDPGRKLDLIYPESTIIGVRPDYRIRQVLIDRVRDLVCDPLTPAEYLRRPYLLRSRWLVSGTDANLAKPNRASGGRCETLGIPRFRVAVKVVSPRSVNANLSKSCH